MHMEIQDQGFFWWADDDSETQRTAGLLTIDSSGLIKLELHETLPGRSGLGGVFGQNLADSISLLGCLKASGQYVLLKGLAAVGGRTGHNSHETFIARECFISQRPPTFKSINKISVSLDDLQQWIRPGKITFDRPKGSDGGGEAIEARLALNPDESLITSSGTLEVIHDFTGYEPDMWAHSINAGMSSRLAFTPTTAMTSEEALDWYRAVQDLLLILTNSNLTLRWPKLFWEEHGKLTTAVFYFRRNAPADSPVKWHEMLLPFIMIRETFATLLENWIDQRKRLGPGISLYLGTRRNKPLYVEHRFVNLVWGLEALDRRVNASSCDDPKLTEKIQRLKKFVAENGKQLNRSDRKWLTGLLEQRSAERPLADRLYDLLKPVAIGLDDTKLKKFTRACADLRNDLSHHGGERKPGDYQYFISELLKKTDALSTLYLLRILNLTGFDPTHIKHMLYGTPNSRQLKEYLIGADLLPDVDIAELLANLKTHSSTAAPQDGDDTPS